MIVQAISVTETIVIFVETRPMKHLAVVADLLIAANANDGGMSI